MGWSKISVERGRRDHMDRRIYTSEYRGHNKKSSYLVWVHDVPRLRVKPPGRSPRGRALRKLVEQVKKSMEMGRREGCVVICVHCNAIGELPSQGGSPHPTKIDDFVAWREENRGDLLLAEKVTAWLRNVEELELYPDPRIGRDNPVLHKPPYEDPEKHGYTMVSKKYNPYFPSCYLETVTLTNYKDEDYVGQIDNQTKERRGVKSIARCIHLAIDTFLTSYQFQAP